MGDKGIRIAAATAGPKAASAASGQAIFGPGSICRKCHTKYALVNTKGREVTVAPKLSPKTTAFFKGVIVEALCDGEQAAERRSIRDYFNNLSDREATSVILRVLAELEAEVGRGLAAESQEWQLQADGRI